MWLITSFGYFTIFQRPADIPAGLLTVGGYARGDLEALRERYLPALGEIRAEAGDGYDFCAAAPREAVIVTLLRLGLDLNYAGLGDAVTQQQGAARAHLYARARAVLETMQEEATATAAYAAGGEPGEALRFGGVLVDAQEQVLLVRPTNETAWTFPQGPGESGRRPEEAVLDIVRARSGYRAQIVSLIPGSFRQGAEETVYYLLRPVGRPGPLERSLTAEVRWLSLREAPQTIDQAGEPESRQRDRAVLLAAISTLARSRGE